MKSKSRHLIGLLFFSFYMLFLPISAFADQQVITYPFNGTVTAVKSGTVTVSVKRTDINQTSPKTEKYSIKPTSGDNFNVGDTATFNLLIKCNTSPCTSSIAPSTLKLGVNPSAYGGIYSTTSGTAATDIVTFDLFGGFSCPAASALECWSSKAFSWSTVAILVLAVAAFVIAGIVYMTSGGNPKRVEMAKKLMIGALSGVAVVVLGRFFLTKVIGVPWL